MVTLRRMTVGDLAHVRLWLDEAHVAGWYQWYRCDAYSDWGFDVGAQPGDAGIDCAVGDRLA